MPPYQPQKSHALAKIAVAATRISLNLSAVVKSKVDNLQDDGLLLIIVFAGTVAVLARRIWQAHHSAR
jgi:hypothetical protein